MVLVVMGGDARTWTRREGGGGVGGWRGWGIKEGDQGPTRHAEGGGKGCLEAGGG